MPRQSRIDAPGALHHIIAGGNEKRKIFEEKSDYQQFLSRLGEILSNTQAICYAWAYLKGQELALLLGCSRTGREYGILSEATQDIPGSRDPVSGAW